MSKKVLDLIWSLDIEKMNDHLPTERKTLSELLEDENPQIQTKKNKLHKIRRKDLELICEILPESEWSKIKLPIILLRRTEMAKGIYSISGGIQELYVVHKLSKKTNKNYRSFILEENTPYIWKPEAFTAIRKAGSIIIVGYT